MVKKFNQKNLSSRNTRNKLNKNKDNRKLQDDEEEEDYPEEVVEDENEEEDEEDEEADNSFIVNDEESEGRNDINVYRDESIFKKKDKDIKTIQEADEEENPSDDQKDENYSVEDQKDQEEAELEENLNESDLEVTQKRPKKKRKLHKVRDLDNEELKREYDELKEDLPKDDDYSQRKRSTSNDGSNDGYYPKNRIKKKKNNLDNFQDYKKENRRNRDDDFIDYGDRPRPRRDRDTEKSEKTQLLEQEIISDEDRIIINADFPERLLIRYNLEELPILSQEIKPELEWICEQKNYIDSPAKKKKIISLLEFLKKEFLDIPYIVTYKYYIFEHDLTKRELWEIYELDKEYQKIMDLKKKVMNNFNTLEPFLNEKIYHNMKEKFIENAKSAQELRNMMNYINYNKEKYLSSNPNISTENKKAYQGPIRKSILSVCFSENLDKCAKQFCLDSNDIASNIELNKNKENLSKLLRPPEPDCSLTDLLLNYKSRTLSEAKVMENICNLIGKEMINHPYIKEFVYEYLRNNCYVSTNPTEEGKKQLDIFHPSLRTKRIRERPVKTFNDDLFLDVLQREKEKLIEIVIEIKENEDESKEFKYIFTQALNSEHIQNNYGIKQEKGGFNDESNLNFNNSTNKSDWYILRENVIKIFFESIFKLFLIDVKKELKEKAEAYVIKECSENFYRLLMSGPYVVNVSELYENRRKILENNKKNKKNNNDEKSIKSKKSNYINENAEEKQNIDETDAKFRDDELPRVISFVYDPNGNCTYSAALSQNGELLEQKIFNFSFQRKRSFNRQNQNQEQEEPLSVEQIACMKFIEKHAPNLIIIGANDLKCSLIKNQITLITSHKDFSLTHYIYITFGDLSIPIIYSNSPMSENEFPKHNMYIKQAISLGRYQQSPLQQILQLWKEDITENYCLKIKLHPMQKYVNQCNLMEKLEIKAIEVVNLCGFDINKGFEFRHLRNTLMFISGFGPKKAKAFIKKLYALERPKSREEILEEKEFKIGKKLGESFINFIKIKTDITSNNYYENDFNLLDMTRIPMNSYDITKKLINDVYKKEETNLKSRKKYEDINEKIEEIIRYPEKLNVLDINEYIKNQSENLKITEIDNLKFTIKLIKEELSNPFRDLRDERKDLQQQQIFNLLIGDDNFQRGMITVAKVISIDKQHVKCMLQNDLFAQLWFNDVFEDSENEKGITKDKIKMLFKIGSAFEARIKNIDYNNYKVDLMTKPSEMSTHKNYIPNVEQLSNFFELTDEDKLNMAYINAHSKKNKKYQPRNIKNERFKNMSYTDCCNYLRNKDIGECVFRPSSIGNNNLTLSYKFYKQIICHLDITEEDKLPGENIGKKLRINNEIYSSLDEILKRYVVPCTQLIKESIKNRKFFHSNTRTDFENFLKEGKKKNLNIINYSYTILKDFPGYLVLGYVPKVNPIYEYIKIKPKGLYFHEQLFPSIDDITNFFKKEYSSEKYREIVRKSAIPTVQYHRSIESHSINVDESRNFNNYSMGSSMGLREGSNYGNIRRQDDRVCNICQKPGHIAKNCKNKDNNFNNNRRRGDRNNYLGGKRNRENRENRDNYDFKKEKPGLGWENDDRDHDNNSWNVKKDKDNDGDNWGSFNSRKGGNNQWNNNQESSYKVKTDNNEDDWGSSDNKNNGFNKGDDDPWATVDNNENKNNIKNENNDEMW